MSAVSAVRPRDERNRAELARVDAYFAGDVPADVLAWVQDRGIGVLHAEVERLRGVVARLEREKR